MRFYREDVFGYDGLEVFSQVFPTYEEWKKLNTYMIGSTVEANEYAEQIYNMLFANFQYKYFRYDNRPRIYTELSGRLSRLYAELEVGAFISENPDGIAGTTTTSENFKTNNTADESDPDNNIRYRTNIDKVVVDNGEGVVALKDRLASGADRIQNFINDLRPMFMKENNNLVQKDLYAK